MISLTVRRKNTKYSTVREDPPDSSMPSSSSSSATLTASVHPPPPPPRVRRLRRVLYPASQSRRPPLREAPDQALRWLLLLSVLVFLQIYTEETHTCTEIQTQGPDLAVCPPQEGEGSLEEAEEAWSLQTAVGASEPQRECVVA